MGREGGQKCEKISKARGGGREKKNGNRTVKVKLYYILNEKTQPVGEPIPINLEVGITSRLMGYYFLFHYCCTVVKSQYEVTHTAAPKA